MHISLLFTSMERSSLFNLGSQIYMSYRSKINTRESILIQSKSYETLLLFILNWQWWEDTVQGVQAEDGWRFNYYVHYISLLQNIKFNRAGCKDFEIDWRYSKDVETSYLSMKYIVRFTLTIIYVMFHFLCML